MALAEWVANGAPPFDLWPVDIRRFGRAHHDTGWVRARTLEAYARHYAIAWPLDEMTTGRPRRRSPLYDRLKAKNAVFGEKLGWERANWFAAAGEQAADIYTFGRQNWFAAVGREHRAARATAALFDQTSFAKFELKGADAEAALAWLCANDTSKPEGRLTYTQLLNDKGGIEADLIVARLAPDRFYIVTGTGYATRDRDWISRNIPSGMAVTLEEVTSAVAVLSLFGPKARAILQPLTQADLGSAAFPFAHVREIHIAGCPVRALRVTYVGELGWELHTPVDYAATLFDALVEEGEPHDLALAGYRAIESLRLEKAYRAWGSDIGPDHNPLQAGLGWAVKLATDIPFKGRDALVRQQQSPLTRRLAGFTTADPTVTLWGRETIHRNGERCGWLSSAGWGYTIEKGIGLGYVRNSNGVDDAYILDGSYELEVEGRLVPAEVFLEAPFDPKNERVRG
jgi:sarcosine dehydrogenase